MRSLFNIVTIIAVAVCLVPGADAKQSPPAGAQVPGATDAPLSPSAIADLFKESAGLGKEEALVLEEAKSLTSEQKTFVDVEGSSIESERVVVRASSMGVMASCDQKDWELPAYRHCPGMVASNKELNEKFGLRVKAYNQRLERFVADKGKLFKRYEAIRARLEKIEAILSRQKAFTNAVDKCDQLGTLEAQSQCMQKQFDVAGTPQRDITIEDPNHITVVRPGTSGGRTPEQAIEEYKNSGPPKPVLRPSGGKKQEPPPPGQ